MVVVLLLLGLLLAYTYGFTAVSAGALSGFTQVSALDLSQNGIGHFGIPRQHIRLDHVSTLLVGCRGDRGTVGVDILQTSTETPLFSVYMYVCCEAITMTIRSASRRPPKQHLRDIALCSPTSSSGPYFRGLQEEVGGPRGGRGHRRFRTDRLGHRLLLKPPKATMIKIISGGAVL